MQENANVKSAASQGEDIQKKLNEAELRKERLTMVLPYAGIVFLVVLFSVLTKGKFIGADNLSLLLNQCYTLVIVIIGATFLYSMGAMDLSLGQVMAVSSMVLSLLYQRNVPLLVCFLVAVIVAVAFMSITATAKNYLKLDSFIASLCISNVASGIVSAVSKKGKIVFPYSKAPWLNGVPVKVVVLVVLLVVGYLLYNYTVLGKSVKAIGGSMTVARISGIKVEKTIYLVYLLMGIMLAIAGVFNVARAGVVDPTTGSSMNLNVMVGIVLGGFPLSGGANSKFSAPIIGALMVIILTNGLGMLGYASAVGYLFKGILFVIVIALTYEKTKGKLVE
ncbi:MAG: ABC transporter permease [Clostridiales bacterium]|nr:ABC transporter permease [Clostridiales bacterium]